MSIPPKARFTVLLVICASVMACKIKESPPTSPLAGAGVDADAPADALDPETEEPEAYEPCEPRMYGDPPGNRGLFAFEGEEGTHGYRDVDGNVAIKPRFYFAYEFMPGGITGVADGKGFAFIDTTGKVVARAFPYDNGPDYFCEGLARIIEDGKVGFIDMQGQVAVEPRFDHVTPFCHGLAAVCEGCEAKSDGEHTMLVGGRWGFVGKEGKVVVPVRFDKVDRFEGETAQAVLDGKAVTIDRKGNVVGGGGKLTVSQL